MKQRMMVVVFALLFSMPMNAIADGSLDGSFGQGGLVVTSFGGVDAANALVVQPDGNLVAAGKAGSNIGMDRYTPDGSLDSSFGAEGKVTTDFGGTDEVNAIIVQPDGGIVVAGATSGDFSLISYDPEGELDSSFGTDGKTSIGGGGDQANALVEDSNGKFVAVGNFGSNFGLLRSDSDGSLDDSFGSGGEEGEGTVSTSFGAGTDSAEAVIVQSNGKILSAGKAGSDFALARYKSDGSLDDSFGAGGRVTTSFGGTAQIQALVEQSDDKFVAAGTVDSDFALARYTPDGSLDSSFGTGGKVTTSFGAGADKIKAIALQPDGKLVVAGSSAGDLIVARYEEDGTLDTTFGDNGKTIIPSADEANAIAIQPGGQLVVAGGAGSDFVVARFLVPSIEVSLPARDLRAKYSLLQSLEMDTVA